MEEHLLHFGLLASPLVPGCVVLPRFVLLPLAPRSPQKRCVKVEAFGGVSMAELAQDPTLEPPLLRVSDDALCVIAFALIDPLSPTSAVAFRRSCQRLRAVLSWPLSELHAQHREVATLCAKVDSSCSALRATDALRWRSCGLELSDCVVLGRLFRASLLPNLVELRLSSNRIGDEGVAVLAQGLCHPGALPQLARLMLGNIELGDAGVAALAAALRKGALAALECLYLTHNEIGDAGLRELAGALSAGALPQLKTLALINNKIGDDGVSCLVAPMVDGALCSLGSLYLNDNRIGAVGLASLACGIRDGALPSLKLVNTLRNPASLAGRKRVEEALAHARAGGGDGGLGGAARRGLAPGGLACVGALLDELKAVWKVVRGDAR